MGIALLCVIFAGYFVFASHLERSGKKHVICKRIEISILDSTINGFISRKDVRELIVSGKTNPIGKNLYEINPYDLEKLLEKKSAIRNCNVSYNIDGTMNVKVTQRRPIIRMETAKGGFYADAEGYIFPLVTTFTSFVPVMTGDIPIDIDKNFRGKTAGKNKIFIDKIVKLSKFINEHEFWNAQIEQIDIESTGDITLYTRIGDYPIYFGAIDNIDYKFAKLMTFYKNIVPTYGWKKYSAINLKFSNQIVCTKRKEKKKII